MRKTRKNLGFTMAELLVVVAIIVILSGVGFIAVQSHQRSLAQLECNTIAKEIFIAAQNHLTMAESQGYLSGTVDFGTKKEEKDKNEKPVNVYYVVGPSSGNILDQMLPFGSIDETVRSGGSYLIRYQTNPARILDVFYSDPNASPSKYQYTIKDDEYSDLLEKSKKTSGPVVGYYGGEEALANGDIILAPTIEVENAERLIVTVTDWNNNHVDPKENNDKAALKMIISGQTSKAKLAITLTNTDNNRFSLDPKELNYTVILDDITTAAADSGITDGLHFADLNGYASSTNLDKVLQFMQNDDGTTPTFIPGENITVQAVAYSNTALTNIAYSSARTTNSLFADPGEDDKTAMIANFRHLENLDALVSGLDGTKLEYTNAEQIDDLVWSEVSYLEGSKAFCYLIPNASIYKIGATAGTTPGFYLPVTPSVAGEDGGDPVAIALTYEGNNHSITGVNVDNTGTTPDTAITAGGLFGSFGVSGGVNKILNLELIDFNIEMPSGNAGALAGTITDTTVSNVLAHNSTGATTINVTTASSSAGGLIGSATDSTIENSAAALIVNSDAGDAGGLIGTMSGGSIKSCFSGGHTNEAQYKNADGSANYVSNVTGSVAVGGLVGDAGEATIENSYSTCSVEGATVGGLVGTGSGSGKKITNCYATGLVTGSSNTALKGAFAGSLSSTPDNCWYFEIINEQLDDANYPYLPALGDNPTDTSVTPIDKDADSYNRFVGAQTLWKPVTLETILGDKINTYYDPKLNDYYKDKTDGTLTLYPLRTVAQLPVPLEGGKTERSLATANNTTATVYFVATHYGDWPAPEIFVLNTKSSG